MVVRKITLGWEKKIVVYDRVLQNKPFGSCGVNIINGGAVLISYVTPVCAVVNGWLTCSGTYSATTAHHISAFLQEYGNGTNYYTAKKCYLDGIAYNIYTGECITLGEYKHQYPEQYSCLFGM